MPTVHRDGLPIVFDSFGTGDPLLLIHGSLLDRYYWKNQTGELSRHYRVIVANLRWVDQPLPKSSGYSIPLFAWDMANLLDMLKLRSVHVCGHDLGGGVALEMALRFPERVTSLTLAETFYHYPYGKAFLLLQRLLAKISSMRLIGTYVRIFVRNPDCQDYVERTVSQLDKNKMLEIWKASLKYDCVQELEKVTCPTLVLRGEAITPLSLQSGKLTASIPGAITHTLPGTGMMLNWDDPQAFNQVLVDFLMGVKTQKSKKGL
jgi:3-oxoadipate enol-lactonase